MWATCQICDTESLLVKQTPGKIPRMLSTTSLKLCTDQHTSVLPLTFQDAAVVAAHSGIHYVWVDCLYVNPGCGLCSKTKLNKIIKNTEYSLSKHVRLKILILRAILLEVLIRLER